ncbi:MAG: YdcF family protein [Cellvibrionaceae bacterium]
MSYAAIIVLGNLMSKEGVLNVESSLRVDAAVNAFNGNEAPVIVTCGWAYRDDSDINIADAMKAYAISVKCLPEHVVIPETTSRDTVGDAVFTKKYLAEWKDWREILVVTSDYHAERAEEIFRFVYGPDYRVDVRGVAVGSRESHSNSENTSKEAFRKTFEGIEAGDSPAIFKRLQESHPFYNGDVYPHIPG